jgi:hypothetical protein
MSGFRIHNIAKTLVQLVAKKLTWVWQHRWHLREGHLRPWIRAAPQCNFLNKDDF